MGDFNNVFEEVKEINEIDSYYFMNSNTRDASIESIEDVTTFLQRNDMDEIER